MSLISMSVVNRVANQSSRVVWSEELSWTGKGKMPTRQKVDAYINLIFIIDHGSYFHLQ